MIVHVWVGEEEERGREGRRRMDGREGWEGGKGRMSIPKGHR